MLRISLFETRTTDSPRPQRSRACVLLLTVCCGASAFAQAPPAPPNPPGTSGAGDHVTVPLSSPGRPATLKVDLVQGSITVTAGANNQVVVDSTSYRGRER